jgi:hypothetical protein
MPHRSGAWRSLPPCRRSIIRKSIMFPRGIILFNAFTSLPCYLSGINSSCTISTLLNSGGGQCKVLLLDVRPPLYYYSLPVARQSIQYQAELEFFSSPTAAATSTSTTPTGLIRIFLASGGNFLLPIVLSTAQLAISRKWPDSDIPRNLEQVKVIVNVVGASATSLVAALNRWRLSRISAAEAGVMVRQVTVDATETTALLGSQCGAHLKRKTSKERQVWAKFDAELIGNIELVEDQTQGFATSLPVTYPSGSCPDAGFRFSCVNVYDRLL